MLYDYLHASSLRGHLCPPWARGSAWRWAKTDTSVHHKTLRIRSAGPELVYRHPNLGAAPPPEPHRGRGRGTAILSNFSFLLGFRPHQWCRIAPHSCLSGRVRIWSPSTSIPSRRPEQLVNQRRLGSRTRCGGVTRGSNDRQARSGVPPWLVLGAS